METFDPKPENTAEFRSVVGSLRTSVPGIEIGGLFPKVAQHADKLAIVRSMAHQQADHAAASHWLMTGHDYPPAANGAPAVNPSLGSMIARSRGATSKDSGLPTYVTTDHLYAGGGSWLGKAYNPFHVRDEGVSNMTPRFAGDRLQDRHQLLQSLDRINRQRDASGTMQALDSFETQAFELLRGTSPTAFDLSREDARVRDAYGPGLGQNLLLARRLCEAGVGFVTVWYGGWDSHGTNPSVGHGTIEQEMHKLAPSFDHSVAFTSAAWTRRSCWSSRANSAALPGSTRNPADVATGRTCVRSHYRAAASESGRSSVNRRPKPMCPRRPRSARAT
jgi:hypothetical protein